MQSSPWESAGFIVCGALFFVEPLAYLTRRNGRAGIARMIRAIHLATLATVFVVAVWRSGYVDHSMSAGYAAGVAATIGGISLAVGLVIKWAIELAGREGRTKPPPLPPVLPDDLGA